MGKMWACKKYDDVSFLVSDLSVECGKGDHVAYVYIAIIFFFLYCIGIPGLAYYVLRPYIPAIHFDAHRRVSPINPPQQRKDGKNYQASDRPKLLEDKLVASTVYGFMWTGFQTESFSPYWEITVINSRKLAMIMMVELMQDVPPNYQMTLALIILFVYNLLHVNFHPYDSYFHDHLEMCSLIVSEMTLFFGLFLNFLEQDKHCQSGCLLQGDQLNSARGTISAFVVLINIGFLVYFLVGVFYHVYAMLPRSMRCKAVEKHASKINKTTHKVFKHHQTPMLDDRLEDRDDAELSQKEIDHIIHMTGVAHESSKKIMEHDIEAEKAKAHTKLQERLRKREKTKMMRKKKKEEEEEEKKRKKEVEMSKMKDEEDDDDDNNDSDDSEEYGRKRRRKARKERLKKASSKKKCSGTRK